MTISLDAKEALNREIPRPVLLLILLCACRTEPSMATLQEAHQVSEQVRCRYSQPSSGQKPGMAGVELGKGWKKLRRRVTP